MKSSDIIKKLNLPKEDTMVLLSGGMESSTLLQLVKENVPARVAAIFLNVGQDSAKRQLAHAQRLCNKLGVPLHVADLPGYVDLYLSTSEPPYAMQDETSCTCDCASLIAVIAAWRLGYKHSYRGFTVSDSERIPEMDDSERIAAIQHLVEVLSRGQHQYNEPFLTAKLTNEDVLRTAIDRNYEYEDTWSCQRGYRYQCGECLSCQKRKTLISAVKPNDRTEIFRKMA